jgi:hypothetical protein
MPALWAADFGDVPPLALRGRGDAPASHRPVDSAPGLELRESRVDLGGVLVALERGELLLQ